MEYHKVVLAEEFMEYLAPTHWPEGERVGFCYQPGNSQVTECEMKKGNPFQPFWDGLNVDFDNYEIYHITYSDYDVPRWKEQ